MTTTPTIPQTTVEVCVRARGRTGWADTWLPGTLTLTFDELPTDTRVPVTLGAGAYPFAAGEIVQASRASMRPAGVLQ